MLDLDLSSLFRGGRRDARRPTIEILTVCTGNVARSPLAEQLLRHRLAPLDVSISSSGTHGLTDAPMTRDAVKLAASLGVPPEDSGAHRARWLDDAQLVSPDLVLAMTREQRTHIVGLAPARVRTTFTVREFERLARDVSDAEVRAAADAAGADPHLRVRSTLALIAERRGAVEPPADPAVDDVVDPYRRSTRTYELAAAQLLPGIEQTVRVLRAALA